MITFDDWLKHYAPRDRAYSPVDLRTGWDAAMQELIVDRWQFRVIKLGSRTVGFGMGEWTQYQDRGDWFDIPLICIRPMCELFSHEIELRCHFRQTGEVLNGAAMLQRMIDGDKQCIPF